MICFAQIIFKIYSLELCSSMHLPSFSANGECLNWCLVSILCCDFSCRKWSSSECQVGAPLLHIFVLAYRALLWFAYIRFRTSTWRSFTYSLCSSFSPLSPVIISPFIPSSLFCPLLLSSILSPLLALSSISLDHSAYGMVMRVCCLQDLCSVSVSEARNIRFAVKLHVSLLICKSLNMNVSFSLSSSPLLIHRVLLSSVPARTQRRDHRHHVRPLAHCHGFQRRLHSHLERRWPARALSLSAPSSQVRLFYRAALRVSSADGGSLASL